MTADERQQIVAELKILDDFASDTPLPRQWHVNWQARYQQVAQCVLKLGEPKEATDAEKPKPEPGEVNDAGTA